MRIWLTVPQDTEQPPNTQNNLPNDNALHTSTTSHVNSDDDALNGNHENNSTEHSHTLQHSHAVEDSSDVDSHHSDDHIKATEELDNDDLPEEISEEDKETIKKVASDDNLSQAKSYASILVEQVIHAKETFKRSLGSLFTSALTAGLEIGISFFVILSAFALLNDVLPSRYAMVLSSLLYPIGFIIVVIGQSLLFTEQTSLLSLPVLNKIEPLHKLLRLWGIVIAGNIVGGCIFAALMIGLGLHMHLFTDHAIDAYAEHILGFDFIEHRQTE